MFDSTQRTLVDIAGHIHQGLAQIQELPSIHTTVLPSEIPGNCSNHGILHETGIQQVNDRLRITANINITIAAGASLNGIKSIEYIRVLAMFVQASNRHRGLSLICGDIHNRLRIVLSGI